MILGWFTDIRWWPGRDGIRIRESGLADLISHSESALESGGGAGLDGDGVIGDSTGITTTRDLTAGGTTPEAERFITGAPMLAADLLVAVVSTGPVEGPDLLMETGRRLEDMLRRAARAGCARVLSAATITADRPGVSHRVEAPASVEGFTAVEDSTEAEAGVGNRNYLAFLVFAGFLKWRDALCSERS
jgi:hypothetical protein